MGPAPSAPLAYRGDAINRARARNRSAIEDLAAQRRLQLRLQTEVVRIEPQRVVLTSAGQPYFLQSIGVEIQTKHGTA